MPAEMPREPEPVCAFCGEPGDRHHPTCGRASQLTFPLLVEWCAAHVGAVTISHGRDVTGAEPYQVSLVGQLSAEETQRAQAGRARHPIAGASRASAYNVHKAAQLALAEWSKRYGR